MCGWLRVATAFIKHQANALTKNWDNEVRDASLCCMLTETMARVCKSDPVMGDLCVDDNKMKVWVDASSMATGVALGVNGSIVKDACWLHPINDPRHINLAELDAVIKGVNLPLQWQARVLHVITDSACVHRLVSDTLTKKARVNTKATSKMLVRWLLGTLPALVEGYMLTMDITLVKSCQNHTDSLTRIPQR